MTDWDHCMRCAPGVHEDCSWDVTDCDLHIEGLYLCYVILDEGKRIVLPAAVVRFVEFGLPTKVTESFECGSSSTVFTVLFLVFWSFTFFCFRQTLSKWFIKLQLLQILPFAMPFLRWFGSQLPPQFEQYSCKWLFGFCKLFDNEQFIDRGLFGSWVAFTLAGTRVLLCRWFWCWLRISSSMLNANSNAWRGSAVRLRSSFWTSGSIKLVMNTSPIRVSSLFLISLFSANCFSLL